MAKPIRTLNKRRRRAELQQGRAMYIAYSERTVDVDGATVVIGNESWNYRTDRSQRSRLKKYSSHVFIAHDGSDFSAIGSHGDVMEAMRDYLKTASPLQR